ncbi:NADH-quinone oxidoreductase subunit C, partial [Thermodesulfobacteriota bacterium]
DTGPESVVELDPEYILDLEVNGDEYLDLVRFLKADKEINTDMLLQLTATDREDHFDIIVHLLSPEHGHKISLRCPVDKEQNEIETISSIFLDAEWHEREVSDLFATRFTGHPDLRQIFLQEVFSRPAAA